MILKLCGLSTPETLATALGAGADMVGLVFHPRSPRYVAPGDAAALAAPARGRAKVAALVVDLADDALDAVVEGARPDLLQLHGAETPERVAAVRVRFRLPVMKAFGVAAAEDLAALPAYRAVADLILLDAKPPPGALYTGGHGRAFDWSLLDALDPEAPVMLSGGLDPGNVGAAVARLGDRLLGVDVSSGIESAPGVKDPALIAAFARALRGAEAAAKETGP